MPTVIINKFDGGITNDPRDPREGVCRMSTGFDILTNPRRMTPYRSSESGDNAPTTSQKQNFAIALWTPSSPDSWRLFALGVVSGSGKAEVLMKTLETGGSTDLSDDTWDIPAANQSSAGATSFDLFVYYHRVGKIYGARAGTNIWAFTPDGSTGFADSAQALTYTSIAQGLVHSKDNILYVPYYNSAGGANAKSFILKYDGSSWTPTALTLPDHFEAKSITEFGNYIAIGCEHVSGVENSIVYLWDRDTSLTTLSESIDWGSGDIKILQQVSGELLGISISGNISSRLDDKVIFRRYTPSGAVKIEEFIFDSGTTTLLPIAKQVTDNRLWFMMSGKINGVQKHGVWSIGRIPDGTFSIVQERTPNNDTALSSGILYNFINVGDFLFQAYNASSAFALSKTNDQNTYSATAIRETTINPKMIEIDRSRNKQLEAVSLSYESLPSSSSVVLFYRVDAGSWIKIFTETTSGTITTKERTKIDAGTEFTSGREYEFKIEATGAKTEITELKYKYKVLPTQI